MKIPQPGIEFQKPSPVSELHPAAAGAKAEEAQRLKAARDFERFFYERCCRRSRRRPSQPTAGR